MMNMLTIEQQLILFHRLVATVNEFWIEHWGQLPETDAVIHMLAFAIGMLTAGAEF